MGFRPQVDCLLDPVPACVPSRDREMLTVGRLDVVSLPQQGELATGTGANETTPARFQVELMPGYVPWAGRGSSP
jgi:hypothetical protein